MKQIVAYRCGVCGELSESEAWMKQHEEGHERVAGPERLQGEIERAMALARDDDALRVLSFNGLARQAFIRAREILDKAPDSLVNHRDWTGLKRLMVEVAASAEQGRLQSDLEAHQWEAADGSFSN